MNLFILLLFSYLLGAIPFGYVIAKLRHINIRNVGSGNIGTTNVYRALGMKYALLVGVLDVAKGAIPTYLAFVWVHEITVIVLAALIAFLGHIFPIYLGGRGGKGVATYAGTLAVLLGWKIFLLLIIVWVICLYTTKIMSLTNVLLSVVVCGFFFVSHSFTYAGYSLIAASIIFWTHRGNLERLRKGTESKLKIRFPSLQRK